MTAHLGGPESDADVQRRHENYLRFWTDGTARVFVVLADGLPVGSVGWWTTQEGGTPVHEMGWFIVPSGQGHGFAREAVTLAIEDARVHRLQPTLIAYPSVTNAASNAVCRAAGFTKHGERVIEFRGAALTVAVWMLDLAATT